MDNIDKMRIEIDVGLTDDIKLVDLRKLVIENPLNFWEVDIVRSGTHNNCFYIDIIGDDNLYSKNGDGCGVEFNLMFDDIQRLNKKVMG